MSRGLYQLFITSAIFSLTNQLDTGKLGADTDACGRVNPNYEEIIHVYQFIRIIKRAPLR